MANCFWDDYEGHKKLHLICMRKEYGGLGILDLKDFNICLLGSWVKRFIKDEGKLWRYIVDRKYCSKENVFCSYKKQASPFWKGVIIAS
jgi:hypothetical protein